MDVEKTDFYKETAMKPQKEWDDAKIREARLDYLKRCADPERHLLGPRQERFIEETVRASAAAGRPWMLFGSQTVMAPLIAPRLLETLPLQPAILRSVCRGALAVGTSDKLAGPEIARQARQYLAMGKYRVSAAASSIALSKKENSNPKPTNQPTNQRTTNQPTNQPLTAHTS